MPAPTDPSLATEAMTAEEGERLVWEYAIGDGKRGAESTERARAEFAVLVELERLRASHEAALEILKRESATRETEIRADQRERCAARCERLKAEILTLGMDTDKSATEQGAAAPTCGLVLDRDENAARNIAILGWGTAVGEGLIDGSPEEPREAPTSPSASGRGVVT